MEKDRTLAFSDGVIAIIITIMVLELKVPHGAQWSDLVAVGPVFTSYVLSFIYVAIYWNNHHHMMYTAERVDGAILWANTHLLFWLSLIPFTTGWMGEHPFAPIPTAVYGLSLLMPALAYTLLQNRIIHAHGDGGMLAKAVGYDLKGRVSLLCYLVSVPIAFYAPVVSCVLFCVVAMIWFLPDPRIEKKVASTP